VLLMGSTVVFEVRKLVLLMVKLEGRQVPEDKVANVG